MRKSLFAALALFASMILAGCGAAPNGLAPAQALRASSSSSVEFLYLAPFRGSELTAGSEVIIAARIAYQLPQAGARLNLALKDEYQRALPLTQQAVVLDKQRGEAFVRLTVKVPTGIQRLTLVAPVTLPGGEKVVGSPSVSFRVVPDAPTSEPSDTYRSIR